MKPEQPFTAYSKLHLDLMSTGVLLLAQIWWILAADMPCEVQAEEVVLVLYLLTTKYLL